MAHCNYFSILLTNNLTTKLLNNERKKKMKINLSLTLSTTFSGSIKNHDDHNTSCFNAQNEHKKVLNDLPMIRLRRSKRFKDVLVRIKRPKI